MLNRQSMILVICQWTASVLPMSTVKGINSVENSWQLCGSPAGNFVRDLCRPDQK